MVITFLITFLITLLITVVFCTAIKTEIQFTTTRKTVAGLLPARNTTQNPLLC